MALISPTELKRIKKERLEGRMEGRVEALRETAVRLQAAGVDLATLAQGLGVSEDQVTAWLEAARDEAKG